MTYFIAKVVSYVFTGFTFNSVSIVCYGFHFQFCIYCIIRVSLSILYQSVSSGTFIYYYSGSGLIWNC